MADQAENDNIPPVVVHGRAMLEILEPVAFGKPDVFLKMNGLLGLLGSTLAGERYSVIGVTREELGESILQTFDELKLWMKSAVECMTGLEHYMVEQLADPTENQLAALLDDVVDSWDMEIGYCRDLMPLLVNAPHDNDDTREAYDQIWRRFNLVRGLRRNLSDLHEQLTLDQLRWDKAQELGVAFEQLRVEPVEVDDSDPEGGIDQLAQQFAKEIRSAHKEHLAAHHPDGS